jgi:hypothetical protein
MSHSDTTVVVYYTVLIVQDVTVTYSGIASEDECKWFIAIWFILLKQINKYDNEFNMHDGLVIFTHMDKN